MAVFKSFKAFRPSEECAEKIPALPYDVMNSDEAREMVKGNPLSFLHVDKAEIDLSPNIDHYSKERGIYDEAQEIPIDLNLLNGEWLASRVIAHLIVERCDAVDNFPQLHQIAIEFFILFSLIAIAK